MLIGLKEAGSNLESGLSYMMLLKEQLVHRVCEQQYSDKDREKIEEKLEGGKILCFALEFSIEHWN